MSLLNYRMFELIVSTGSLRKAAESLHLTPSAVSHSLMKLEKEFGVPLLIRGRTGIELTEYGHQILPYIRSIVAMDQKLHQELETISGVLRGTVRIGVINSVCCCWMPSIIRQMKQEYPDVQVKITQGGYDELETGLMKGTLDLAFVSIPTKNNIASIPLMRDRLLCITPTDFVPINQEYITLEELKKHEVIIPGPGSDFDAIAFMKKNNLELQTQHNIIEDSSIIALVECGLGFSIIPELVLQGIKGNVNVYPIENAPYRMLGIATCKNDLITAATDVMLKMILNYVQVEYSKEMPYYKKI